MREKQINKSISYANKKLKNLPVLPIPALQCTTIGGPLGCPAHVSPNACTICCCFSRTFCRKVIMAIAVLGTP